MTALAGVCHDIAGAPGSPGRHPVPHRDEMIRVIHDPASHCGVGIGRPAMVGKRAASLCRGKERLESLPLLTGPEVPLIALEREDDVQRNSQRDRRFGKERVRPGGDRGKGDEAVGVN